MTEYAGYVYTKVVGKKFIFFPKKENFFRAIYYDTKFYKKKKWPQRLGAFRYFFKGKGNYFTVPTKLQFVVDETKDKTFRRSTYTPSADECSKFLDAVDGEFEILDSAMYDDLRGKVRFDVYNIFDKKNSQYVIFIIGCHSSGNILAHRKMLKLLNKGFRKAFISNK